MSTPIRVAYVIQNLNYGGMERVLHSLARRLPPLGFDVHIVVLEYYGRFAEGLEDSVTFHRVPPMGPWSLFRPVALTEALRGIAPDVVHSHSGVWFKASNAARRAGVAVVVHTEHGRQNPIPLIDRLIDNWASRRTDAVIAVSEPLAEALRRQVMHDPSRVRVMTNGVDVDHLHPAGNPSALRMELGLPVKAFVIGSVGRLEPVKNYRLALRAMALLGRQADGSVPIVLALVGDGSERAGLEALAAESGLADRVIFLGWREDADRCYGAFDLFTLPSRSEGTSISLLEAMSSAVCPVVTDVGGNRAVLGTELASLLVPDNDATALAEAWSRLSRDSTLRTSLAHLARRRVVDAFSLNRMVDEHARLYRELVTASRTGG